MRNGTHLFQSRIVHLLCGLLVCVGEAIAACPCENYAFWHPSSIGGVNLYKANGQIIKSYSTPPAPGLVHCSFAGDSFFNAPISYPITIRLQSDNSVFAVITQGDASGCLTNGISPTSGTVTNQEGRVRFRIRNDTGTNQQYQVAVDGGNIGTSVSVPPGGYFEVDYTGAGGNLSVVGNGGRTVLNIPRDSTYWSWQNPEEPIVVTQWQFVDTGQSGNPPPPNVITWTANTNTVSQGDVRQAAETAHNDALAIQQALNRISSQLTNNSGSGPLNVTVTNSDPTSSLLSSNAQAMTARGTNATGTGAVQRAESEKLANEGLTNSGVYAIKGSIENGIGNLQGVGQPTNGVYSWVLNADHTIVLDSNDSRWNVFVVARRVLEYLLLGALVMGMWRELREGILKALAVPQATTAGTTVLGTNANAAFAVAMAALIIAVCLAIPAAVSTVMAGSVATWFSIGNDVFSGLMTLQGAEFVVKLFPIITAVSCLVTWITFRLIFDIAVIIAASVVKGAVGG